MRSGLLIRLRKHSFAAALAFAGAVLTLFGVVQPARARLDPLRIVTTQIVRPNILVVIDTSGSMQGTPDSSDTYVGSDCYHGVNCTATANSVSSAKCQDTTTSCYLGNTCNNGTACTPGTAAACAAGTFTTGLVCGASPTPPYTVCSGSTLKCPDGVTACTKTGYCADRKNTCTSDSKCNHTTLSYHCVGSASKSCTNVNAVDSACGTDMMCAPGYCIGTLVGCTPCGAACAAATCSSSKCSTDPNVACSGTNASGCPAPQCILVDTNTCGTCATGACTKFCNATTPCTTKPYCTPSMNPPTLECADGNACNISAHCYNKSEPCFNLSSRLGIAKHVAMDVITANQNLANFGFLSFNQGGYYEYWNGGSCTTTYRETLLLQSALQVQGAFSNNTPASSITSGLAGDLVLNLESGANSSYLCGTSLARVAWAGLTWFNGTTNCTYQGSYYSYGWTGSGGSGSTTSTNAPYAGHTGGCSGCTFYDVADNISTTSVGTSDSCESDSNSNLADGNVRVPVQMDGNQSSTLKNILTWLSPDDQGGLTAGGNTPAGCVLMSKTSASPYTTTFASAPTYRDAASYLSSLRTSAADPNFYNTAYPNNTCRSSSVILITDGEPNGPGDTGCDTCSFGASGTTCTCHAVQAAYYLNTKFGIKTYVVGLSGSTMAGTALNTLNNIARAGGGTLNGTAWTDPAVVDASNNYAYFAATESVLTTSLQNAINQAAAGDYTTTAPTVATSSGGTQAGNIGILSSTQFPTWKGHLRAFDLYNYQTDCSNVSLKDIHGNYVPKLKWDAGCALRYTDWKARRVFTSDTTTKALIPFTTDTNGTINTSALSATALGGSAAAVAKWAMGYRATPALPVTYYATGTNSDPTCITCSDSKILPANNADWKLGTIVNSTPVAEAPQLNIAVNSHAVYAANVKSAQPNRPSMVYAGSDDGMLHAFYLEDFKDTSGNVIAAAGTEAWAYVPPSLLPSLVTMYNNGGQLADAAKHVYGVASSPKVLDVCTDTNGSCTCTSPASCHWATVLVTGLGPGGSDYFSLDIGALPNASTPFKVLWSTDADTTHFSGKVGQSWSVPAFAFPVSAGTNYSRLFFGSGYDPVPDGSDQVGYFLSVVDAYTGTPLSTFPKLASTSSPSGGLSDQYFALLADSVVARTHDDYGSGSGATDDDWTPQAAYSADLAGRVWRLNPAEWVPSGTPTVPTALYAPSGTDATNHPFYYSPAVIKLPQLAANFSTVGQTVIALNDGTFDDADWNPPLNYSCGQTSDCPNSQTQTCTACASPTIPCTGSTPPTKVCLAPVPRVTVLYEKSGAVANADIHNINLTDLCMTTGTTPDSGVPNGCAGAAACSACPAANKFNSYARPIGSPLLLLNSPPGAGQPTLQALFLIYQPQAACNLGMSVLVVLDLAEGGIAQSQAMVMTTQGKASGMIIGGGTVMVATPGTGAGGAAGLHMGPGAQGSSFGTTIPARFVGVTEKDED